MTEPLTRIRAAGIVDVVTARWLRSTHEPVGLIAVNVLIDQIGDALRSELERCECEQRVALLRVRILRLIGEF